MSEHGSGDPSSRTRELDVVRGLAIVLVLLGHAIQWTDPGFDSSTTFRLIYSFHMPLFFFVSGVANARAIRRPLAGLLASRARGLLLPFLSWWMIGYALSASRAPLDEALRELYRSPDVGLWFLWVLFWAIVLTATVTRLAAPRWSVMAITLTALLLWADRVPVLGVSLLAWYFPFFAAGVLASGRVLGALRSPRPLHTRVALAAGVLWFVLALGWHRSELTWIAQRWAEAGLVAPHAIDLASRYVTAGAGALAVTLLASRLLALRTIGPGLGYVGCRTLEIYASHAPLLSVLVGAGLAYVPLLAAAVLALALLLGTTLGEVPLLGLLLYGRKPKATAT